MALVLIADDRADVLAALRLLLHSEGHECLPADSPDAAMQAAAARDPNLAVIDLNYARDTTSGAEGLELIEKLRTAIPGLPVIVMTAWGSIDLVVEAMRRGAADFIQKPWENARLLSIVRMQCALADSRAAMKKLQAENLMLRGEGRLFFIAESAAMRPVKAMIERVAPTDVCVLISGEHGTGKEVAAQMLHRASARADGPIVPVNLGGLAESLFESEMFGHVKGAFTGADAERMGRFELADGGTLFLDEIANISLAQQARLLRVIETGIVERVGSPRQRKVDARIVSATNADLAARAASGEFREDLLFRLNAIEIHLPPLRDRGDDIDRLADAFLAKAVLRYGKDVAGFSEKARKSLRAHSWPGNVRELDHAVQRAALLASGIEIQPSDLGLDVRGGDAGQPLEEMRLDEAEAWLIRRALERRGGNAAQAAEDLGVSRSAMYRRIEKYGL